MKVAVTSFGSLGDIQPFVAFALALQRAGHSTYLVAPSDFGHIAKQYGVPFRPMSIDTREFINRPDVKRIVESGNLLHFLIARRQLDCVLDRANQDLWELTEDAEAMVYKAGAPPAAYSIARKRGLPSVEVMYVPLDPSAEHAALGAGMRKTGGRFFNRLMGEVTYFGFWRMYARSANLFRRNVLKMPPISFFGPIKEYDRVGQPTLYIISPTVLPKPRDWRKDAHVIGYLFLDDPPGWQPPPDLCRFLDQGDKPVYIGFGSMPSSDPIGKTRIILEGLRRTGQRAVFHGGSSNIGDEVEFPQSVFQVGFVPYRWLFPRVAAVMHHGGTGTTAWTLCAGVPSIVVPHNFDQPYVSQRMYELGVTPAPLPFKRLTPERVAEAIEMAVSDIGMRARAELIGKSVRAEDGLQRAVELFDQYIHGGLRASSAAPNQH